MGGERPKRLLPKAYGGSGADRRKGRKAGRRAGTEEGEDRPGERYAGRIARSLCFACFARRAGSSSLLGLFLSFPFSFLSVSRDTRQVQGEGDARPEGEVVVGIRTRDTTCHSREIGRAHV